MKSDEDLVLEGINDGRRAFTGPEIVQIDLTNDCNLNCVGCWCHSSLLGNERLGGAEKRMNLPFSTVKKLINDLAETGTSEVWLSGSGEPFMHPKIMDVIRLIKEKGMKCQIITNFTLVNEKILQELVGLKVDEITVSLWAGTPETYVKTHPNQTEKTFQRIREMLQHLHSIKKEDGLPQVRIYNVVSNLNCHEIEEMLDFALETMADFVEFQVIDTIAGKTDGLALSKKEKDRMITQFEKIRKRVDFPFELGDSNKKISEITEFGRLFKPDKSETGKFSPRDFKFETWYDEKNGHRVFKLTCPAGKWTTHHVIKENKNRLVPFFSESQCTGCKLGDKCLDGNNGRKVVLEYLKLLGFGSFYRRISSETVSDGVYDKTVDSIPCYVGWTYARVMANGDVIPCCKAHRMPLGNLNSGIVRRLGLANTGTLSSVLPGAPFRKIWKSEKYGEFRDKALKLPKSDPYFKDINCYKSCDNYGMNLDTHGKILHGKKKRPKPRVLAKRGVTLYVPCFNSENTLGECIESVLRQTYPLDEIIVVDDGSTDKTVEIASKFPVRVIPHGTNLGLGTARNTAVKNAGSELVAALDSDCVASDDWLENLMESFTDNSITGVGGMVIESEKSIADRWRSAHMGQSWGNKKIVNPEFLFGSNTVFRMDVLERFMYNSKYKTNHEDVDLSKRAMKDGFDIAYDPGAVVRHMRTDTLKSALFSSWAWTLDGHVRPDSMVNLLRRVKFNAYKTLKYLVRDLQEMEFRLSVIDLLIFPTHVYLDAKFCRETVKHGENERD